MPEGYAALVTMIDYKSKWVEAQPLESKHALWVASFMHSVMCRLGALKVFISDQGKVFCNEVVESFLKLADTKKLVTSPTTHKGMAKLSVGTELSKKCS